MLKRTINEAFSPRQRWLRRLTVRPARGWIVGTSTVTFTGLADTAANLGILAGTSSITFSETATLSGTGALRSESERVKVTPMRPMKGMRILESHPALVTPRLRLISTGDLTERLSTLQGTASFTFTTPGLLTGLGALEGSAAITFTPTATSLGGGAISGSASITFTESADLEDSLGNTSGQATFAFSDVAVLTGRGELAGVASITFGHFARINSLRGMGQPLRPGFVSYRPGLSAAYLAPSRSPFVLSGSTSVSFVNSGTLTAAQAGTITGTASFSFGEFVQISATGQLAGVASIGFSESADLGFVGRNPIEGAASLTFSETATLTATGALSGTAPLEFVITDADLSAGRIEGSASITFSLSATPRVRLVSAISVTFGSSANLTATGALSGSAGFTITARNIELFGSASITFSLSGNLENQGTWHRNESAVGSWMKEGTGGGGWIKETSA